MANGNGNGNGGRPPLRDDKTIEGHTLGFFDDQWAAMTAAANQAGETVSAWVRDAVDTKLQQAEPPPKDTDRR